MSLRLTIENVPVLTSGDPIEILLEQHGTVIGRAAHADWTLPDPRNLISSVHCEIDYRDGRYYLTDRSTNGTFINGAPDRPAKPIQLRDGDLVQIGHYHVRVEEIPEDGGAVRGPAASGTAAAGFGTGLDWTQGGGGAAVSKPVRADTFGREPARSLFQTADDPLMRAWTPPAAAPRPPAAPVAGDPFGLAGGGAGTPAAGPAGDPFGIGGAAPPAHTPPAYTPIAYSPPAYAPPPAQPPGDPFGIAGAAAPPAAPVHAPPPAAGGNPWAALQTFGTADFGPAAAPPAVAAAPAALPSAPAAGAGEAGLFDRFLAAAGLTRRDIGDAAPESVVEAAGQLLRQTADGLIRLLDSRTRVRHQFGVGAQVTTYQRSGNNPLKWTRSPETALKQMIGAPEANFLPGAQAVRGAFEDLQAHELAMIAAMQEAMQATIGRFAPDSIKARIAARGWLKSVLPGSREATLWRAYETEFRAFADETEAAYLDLFAKHFKQAYERNVAKASQP